MIYVFIIAVIAVVSFIYFANKSDLFFAKSGKQIHHSELVKTLLNIEEKSLNELLELYGKEFGAGAAKYARRTLVKWKEGKVRPSGQTFRRLLIHLPKAMSYDLKCEVLRRLMEEYCSRKDYQITVYTDNWEETLAPLVQEIIDKSYTAELPAPLERQLNWLADGETQIAQSILKRSQVEEGRIAVSQLRQEFANIENLLASTHGKKKVTHEMRFPYGTITLNIKRR